MQIPEEDLWIAVLRIAIYDYLRGDSKARDWIFSSKKTIGSCRWICDILNIRLEELLIKVNREKYFIYKRLGRTTFIILCNILVFPLCNISWGVGISDTPFFLIL